MLTQGRTTWRRLKNKKRCYIHLKRGGQFNTTCNKIQRRREIVETWHQGREIVEIVGTREMQGNDGMKNKNRVNFGDRKLSNGFQKAGSSNAESVSSLAVEDFEHICCRKLWWGWGRPARLGHNKGDSYRRDGKIFLMKLWGDKMLLPPSQSQSNANFKKHTCSHGNCRGQQSRILYV